MRICVCSDYTFKTYTVTQLWFVFNDNSYHIQNPENFLNIRIEQYFPNTLYNIDIEQSWSIKLLNYKKNKLMFGNNTRDNITTSMEAILRKIIVIDTGCSRKMFFFQQWAANRKCQKQLTVQHMYIYCTHLYCWQ